YPFVVGPGIDTGAAFSPDGRWLAYSSDESGAPQIYVRPFPMAPGRFQVSANGGTQPQWRRDGKELFFVGRTSTMMAASVVRATSDGFEAGIAAELFKAFVVPNSRRQYAVAKDGQRFLLIRPQGTDQSATPQPLTVVVNWLASVQK